MSLKSLLFLSLREVGGRIERKGGRGREEGRREREKGGREEGRWVEERTKLVTIETTKTTDLERNLISPGIMSSFA